MFWCFLLIFVFVKCVFDFIFSGLVKMLCEKNFVNVKVNLFYIKLGFVVFKCNVNVKYV